MPKDERLPRLCGGDVELGNFVLRPSANNRNGRWGSGDEAARLLLGKIHGYPMASFYRPARWKGWEKGLPHVNEQDWGRKYSADNGGCVYIDMGHLELCLPEVISAYDHVAAWHAMLRVARHAQAAVNEDGKTNVQVLVNNSDGQGHSYGSHLNFLVARQTWDNIFRRKMHYLLYLAAFQASSIVYTGQGKVGSENERDPVDFQISQRADFFEQLVGVQTTNNRPIVNSRDEPLTGYGSHEEDDMARLHCIFFDNTLAQVPCLLKVGVMQIILTMIEQEQINPMLILDDPIEALINWSHDPTLESKARMASGACYTAVELQLKFLADAKAFVAAGGCDGIVPRVNEIMDLWEDTLLKLKAKDMGALMFRLDWVLKYSILQQVLKRNPQLDWDSLELKHLDLIYSSLDPNEGLFWAYKDNIETVVDEERIAYFTEEPPTDTRAWGRAMLLRYAPSAEIDDVDWDLVRFRGKLTGYRSLSVFTSNPLGFTKEMAEPYFDAAESFEHLLELLGATTDSKWTTATTSNSNFQYSFYGE